MTRKEYYQRNYATSHAKNGGRVQVPEAVERVSVHEPCFFCGEAKGLCRHRRPVW
jgi:hypothetical protein